MKRTCRTLIGKVCTGSTYIGDGYWEDHYADRYCGAVLVNGQCPNHRKRARKTRLATTKKEG